MEDDAQGQPKVSGGRSYWPGIAFVVAAGIAKGIGMAVAGSTVGSARASRSFLGAGLHLGQAATIQGVSDAAMLILGVIGIALLIRAAVSRSRSKTSGH